jgi:hypothetical protein
MEPYSFSPSRFSILMLTKITQDATDEWNKLLFYEGATQQIV